VLSPGLLSLRALRLLLLLCSLALVEACIDHSPDPEHHFVVVIVPGTQTRR
jgi:hypothetical protein